MFTLATLKKSTAVLALLGAVAGPAAAMAPVTGIDVTTESMAVADEEAMAYLGSLTTDLEAAIAERVMLSEGDEAVDVDVDIRNVAMNGTPIGPDATEFNQLDGVVTFKISGTEQSVYSAPVQIAAYQADGFVPEGFIVITPDNADFYTAMVQGFAIETAALLDNVDGGMVKSMRASNAAVGSD